VTSRGRAELKVRAHDAIDGRSKGGSSTTERVEVRATARTWWRSTNYRGNAGQAGEGEGPAGIWVGGVTTRIHGSAPKAEGVHGALAATVRRRLGVGKTEPERVPPRWTGSGTTRSPARRQAVGFNVAKRPERGVG